MADSPPASSSPTSAPAAAGTPVRALAPEDVVDGVRILSRSTLAYRDGGEDLVYDRLRAATDVSSTSPELDVSADPWHVAYHLAWARANVVRAFDLPADAAVLEIGAGCGAVTRYLGETCASVDAVEPQLHRARVARERTRDLPHVEVFAGMLEDVPETPAYDVVVVVGVLEYVAGGADDPAAYEAFLAAIRRRLNPGGVLVLAIENALGVKYLAGEPEDHSGRRFDGVEGYAAADPPARTFSRSVLTDRFVGAGLDPTFYGAFPDYKMTRTVHAPRLATEHAGLAARIPRFPSAAWNGLTTATVDEERLWESLSTAGLGEEFTNSFVVVARRADDTTAPVGLWPAERLATMVSTGRAAARSLWCEFRTAGDAVHVVRRSLTGLPPGDRQVAPGFTAVLPDPAVPDVLVDGLDLPRALVDAGPDRTAAWMAAWADLVRAAGVHPGRGVPVDLVPQNVVVDAAGELHVIDQEWFSDRLTVDDVLRRGAFTTAWRLAELAPLSRWRVDTRRELAVWLGGFVGLPADGAWLSDAVAVETVLQGEAADTRVTRDAPAMAKGISDRLAQPFAETLWGRRELGQDEREQWAGALEVAREHAARSDADLLRLRADDDAAFARLNAEIHALRADHDALRSSTTWRLLTLVGRLRGRGRG